MILTDFILMPNVWRIISNICGFYVKTPKRRRCCGGIEIQQKSRLMMAPLLEKKTSDFCPSFGSDRLLGQTQKTDRQTEVV